ncbi:MAG: peptidase domain-containing ABC transporter [Ruminococcus sp.]|nr:peptidase domain-containing ABC transporter [Ruminococcus sp.]
MKNRLKVPMIKQVTQTECGLCCCLMILRYYKSRESMKRLQEDADVGRDGLSIKRMKQLLTDRGMKTSVFHVTDSASLVQFTKPFVAFWDNMHYVLIEKVKNGKYYIKNPAEGSAVMEREEFDKHFSGIILTAEPDTEFVPVRKNENNMWKDVIGSLKNHKLLMFEIILLLALTYAVSLITPILIQKIIDRSVVVTGMSGLKPFIYAVAGFTAGYAVVSILKSLRLVALNILIGYHLEADTYRHLLKLPYKFYEQRTVGDLLFRLSSTSAVKDLIATQLLAGVIDIGTLIVTFVYMMNKSPVLSVITLGFFVLNILLVLYIQPKITKAVNDEVSEKTLMQSSQVETIYSIQSVKLSCLEDVVYNGWKKIYDRAVKAFRRKIIISSVQNSFNSIITIFAPIFILLCGIGLYLGGRLSLGEVVAFESVSVNFLSYISQIISTYMQFVTTDEYMQRISDIWYAEEEKRNCTTDRKIEEGSISIRDVSFSYNKSAKKVLDSINIEIPAGSRVAFVGASGSGKSTLSKLITGLYPVTEGEILCDGIPLDNYDKKNICSQIGIVPQDAMLFNKSIYDNIVMNGEDVDMERVKECCRYACIDEEIESMPMGYNTIISEMGMNLSGGQRQRILLARAMVNTPKILVLDEATSSLDNTNEKKISDYLKQQGCTQIVIAHRLSTIIDADRIYVFSDGKVCEYGSHSELLQLRGIYYSLYNHLKSA